MTAVQRRRRRKTGALTFRKQNKSHLKAHTLTHTHASTQYALGPFISGSTALFTWSDHRLYIHRLRGTRTNRYRNRCSYFFFRPRCHAAVTVKPPPPWVSATSQRGSVHHNSVILISSWRRANHMQGVPFFWSSSNSRLDKKRVGFCLKHSGMICYFFFDFSYTPRECAPNE